MDLPVEGIYRPSTFDEAVAALSEEPTMLPIAGGTDVSVQLRAGSHSGRRLLDISGVLPTSISGDGDFLEIGAGATMDQIADSDAVQAICPALCEAARKVGAWPIQCRATLGGNLANASPAADTAPPLLVTHAVFVAASINGLRHIKSEEFFAGPGETTLRPGELIRSIRLPITDSPSFSRFTKLGWQREQIISVVSLSVGLHLNDQGVVTQAAVALGAVAATPRRAPTVEAVLVGRPLDPEAIGRAVEAVQDDIAPIDDVRAPAWYRRVAVATLLERLLEEAAGA
ncbi:MAG: xanthine dehydrogenase family protein subunit M [Acidobacteriota bacterium]